MMPNDARPEADEVGHDSSTCTVCQARLKLQADYQSFLDEKGKALLRQAVQDRQTP